MKRPLLIAAGVVVFLAICVPIARWLNTDTVERGAVTELLRAQARGDADAMLAKLKCADAACEQLARVNAQRLKAPGELKIALYQSGTSHAISSKTKATRVVWFTPGKLTTVQCVLVRRSGNVLAGTTVSLLRVSAPIGREASCP